MEEIELSAQSRSALEQLLAAKSAALLAANGILKAAEAAAQAVVNQVDEAYKNKVTALLEANDIPDGDTYYYEGGKLIKERPAIKEDGAKDTE
jgi:hypothetical protein